MGEEVFLHKIITSTTIKANGQLYILAALRLGKETVWIFRLLDTRVSLGNVGKWKTSCPCHKSNPESPAVQPVAHSQYSPRISSSIVHLITINTLYQKMMHGPMSYFQRHNAVGCSEGLVAVEERKYLPLSVLKHRFLGRLQRNLISMLSYKDISTVFSTETLLTFQMSFWLLEVALPSTRKAHNPCSGKAKGKQPLM